MTAIRTDYHMHSTFSPDGHAAPAELCRQALALGLTEIAITDHMEWEPGGPTFRPDYPQYFDALAACQAEFGPQGLTVLSGVELGNPHEHRHETAALLAAYSFDVVIASVHWLDGANIHAQQLFVDADPYAIYARYFTSMQRMAEETPCHLVAHFDRIFWPGTTVHGHLDTARLEPHIRPVLAAMAARGLVLELNTRFLTHTPGWNDVLVAVCRWYRAEGGAHVAVNSDAHRPSDIARHADQAAALVQSAGFAGPSLRKDWRPAAQPAGVIGR